MPLAQRITGPDWRMLAYVPSLVAPVVVVGHRQQGGAVASLGLGEGGAERRPGELAVHRRHRRRLHRHVVDRPAAVGLHRGRLEGGDQGVPAGADVDVGEGALGALLAPRRPVVERLLEADAAG